MHLQAALAFWKYCDNSARYLFAGTTGDPIADRLLDALREAGPVVSTARSSMRSSGVTGPLASFGVPEMCCTHRDLRRP